MPRATSPKASDAPIDLGALSREELAQKAVREALIDVVWSNIEIPQAMKGVVARGSTASAYSKARGAERVLIGSSLRPSWPEGAAAGSPQERDASGYGWNPDFSPEAELEFLRMHTLRQYGHFVYSDDDMPKMASLAKSLGVDERLFALLETVRVEGRMGISMGREFNWENFYPEQEADKLPAVQRPIFHWLREGFMRPEGDAETRAKLNDFHGRLIGAFDSREVMDLAREWADEIFPLLAPEQGEPDHDSSPDDGSKGSAGAQPSPGDGSGSPESGQGAGDGSRPTSGSDGPEGSEGSGETPRDPAPSSSAEPPGAQPGGSNPYGAANPQQPGSSSMVEQIMAGAARDARAEAAASESAHTSSPSGSDASKGKGSSAKGKSGSGKEASPGSALVEISAPSLDEAKSERRGHAYSKGVDSSDGGNPPAPGEWRATPSNAELLEGSTDLFRHMGGPKMIDSAETARAKRVLERMLTGQTRAILSDTPSKRMSARHLGRGEIKYTRREDFSRGAMHIDIVVDCSGSMRGKPIDSARSLLSALSELSAKGLVHGRAIFSSGEGWMACPLPMKPEKIARIQAFSGSEGIQRALCDNVRKLRESDAVFVYTDAQITDRSFSKTDLKTKKVEPLGLYVGDQSAEPGMSEYFDRYVIRESLEDLCSAMVQRFLSQKKLVAATQAKKAKLRR